MKTEIPYDFMPPEQHFDSPEELLSAYSSQKGMESFGFVH